MSIGRSASGDRGFVGVGKLGRDGLGVVEAGDSESSASGLRSQRRSDEPLITRLTHSSPSKGPVVVFLVKRAYLRTQLGLSVPYGMGYS